MSVFERCLRWRDPWGKQFALLPLDTTPDEARELVIETFVVNADTGYATAPGCEHNDFEPEPFDETQVARVRERQRRNAWSYRDVEFVHTHGGRLVATPTGLLMASPGSGRLRWFAQRGGTCWGEIFVLNVDPAIEPTRLLQAVVESGRRPRRDGTPSPLALDRLLHHEERHARQWAAHGFAGFIARYLWEQLRRRNDTEIDAGLADGGYVTGRA